jgi:hypothetical protein
MPDRFFQIGGENIRVEQTGGFITLDYNHEQIHLGHMFVFDNYGTVGDGGTLNWLITPGTALNLHAEFGINVTGAGRVYLYENPTGSAGSALTAYNMNRDSTITCTASFASTPSITDIGGTVALMNGVYIPAGAGVANRVGGGLRSDQEFILDSGKKYLYRYVNISGAAGTVSFYGSVYEEESE